MIEPPRGYSSAVPLRCCTYFVKWLSNTNCQASVYYQSNLILAQTVLGWHRFLQLTVILHQLGSVIIEAAQLSLYRVLHT